MARLHKLNLWTYTHPVVIAFGTADADLAGTVFRVAVPGPAVVYDWGIAVTTAQVGGSGYLVGLQKQGTATNVANQITATSTAAGAEATATGNGTAINSGDSLEINVDVTGTVSTGLSGALWIRFRV